MRVLYWSLQTIDTVGLCGTEERRPSSSRPGQHQSVLSLPDVVDSSEAISANLFVFSSCKCHSSWHIDASYICSYISITYWGDWFRNIYIDIFPPLIFWFITTIWNITFEFILSDVIKMYSVSLFDRSMWNLTFLRALKPDWIKNKVVKIASIFNLNSFFGTFILALTK